MTASASVPPCTRLLAQDSDATLRGRLIRLAGMHRRTQLLDAVITALGDTDTKVRLEAIIAVDRFSGRLGPEQEAVVDSLARLLLHDDDIAVRNEAMIRVASQVDEVLTKARQATLESRLSEAESIYADALATDPTSQRAHYQLGVSSTKTTTPSAGSTRYEHTVYCWMCLCYLTNHTWMGDSTTRPGAMRPGPHGAYQFSFGHTAATSSEHRSHFFIGRTAESLWIGFYGEDAEPENLVAKITLEEQEDADQYEGGPVGDESIWTDDIIELFIDTNFNHSSYAHIGINNLGVRVDEWIARSRQEMFESGDFRADFSDETWRAGDDLATHIGSDHWALEYRIDFDDTNIPSPTPGTVWGFNLIRVYRGQEYNQWVRTYSGGHSPDDFGVLLFQ